jgi:DNA-directed RNA polymerase specialized sigma24 family protein
MTELLNVIASPWEWLLVVALFGFVPGFCLRLIVLAYPRKDPRRAELIAQLYTVPRIQRPLWVAEQLETALFEGLPHRLSAAKYRTNARERVATELARGVAQLDRDQQECLSLRIARGLSVSATAAVMGRNGDAVKALEHQALGRLRQLLPEEMVRDIRGNTL